MRKIKFRKEEAEGVKIGEYSIHKWNGPEGGFWINHESGEGMQIDEKRLRDAIHKFYTENF